jgi:hypothetical protein
MTPHYEAESELRRYVLDWQPHHSAQSHKSIDQPANDMLLGSRFQAKEKIAAR